MTIPSAKLAPYLRQQDAIRMDRLQSLPITLIGAGSIGSVAALWLCKMGIQTLRVYDPDFVEEHNFSNQVYGMEHIGQLKVVALEDAIHHLGNVDIEPVEERYDGINADEVVISGVDSMASRKEIWRMILAAPLGVPPVRLYIDARMGLDTLRVFCVNPALKEHRHAYKATLIDDQAASHDPCTARTVCYTPLMTAALICNSVKRYVNDEPLPFQVVFDAVTHTCMTIDA